MLLSVWFSVKVRIQSLQYQGRGVFASPHGHLIYPLACSTKGSKRKYPFKDYSMVTSSVVTSIVSPSSLAKVASMLSVG